MSLLSANAIVSADSLTTLGTPAACVSAAVLPSGNRLAVNRDPSTVTHAQIWTPNNTVYASTDVVNGDYSAIAATSNGTSYGVCGQRVDDSSLDLFVIAADGSTTTTSNCASPGFNWTGGLALSPSGATFYLGSGSNGGIQKLIASTGVVDSTLVTRTTDALVTGSLRCLSTGTLLALWQPFDPAPSPGDALSFLLARYADDGTPEASTTITGLSEIATPEAVNALLMLDPDGLHVWVALSFVVGPGLAVQKRLVSDLSLVSTLTNTFSAFDGFVAPVNGTIPS